MISYVRARLRVRDAPTSALIIPAFLVVEPPLVNGLAILAAACG